MQATTTREWADPATNGLAQTTGRARMRVLAILNVHGKAAASLGRERIHPRVAEAFAAAGVDATIELVRGAELVPALQTALGARAAGETFAFDALVVGGGDGTIGTAAAHLAGTGIPLGVLPLGTLNHFARDLRIPDQLELACMVIAECNAQTVDIAEVNGQTFVNNASIGIYPYMLEIRDRQRRALGLGKWGAMVLAFGWMMRRFPMHRLTIRTGEGERRRKTPCAFIGNNRYAVEGAALGTRAALDRGELCVYVARSASRLHLLWVLLKAAFGRMRPLLDFDEIRAEALTIDSRAHRLRVALDGELRKMVPPLRYRSRPGALRVLAPRLGID
ncbi:MAG TPA: diacylglycerol kinase family protein [Alphaproteobacteria bacterium]|nr:diacylglycerol kinase family protein [Alphaproteobacteria bacterium]